MWSARCGGTLRRFARTSANRVVSRLRYLFQNLLAKLFEVKPFGGPRRKSLPLGLFVHADRPPGCHPPGLGVARRSRFISSSGPEGPSGTATAASWIASKRPESTPLVFEPPVGRDRIGLRIAPTASRSCCSPSAKTSTRLPSPGGRRGSSGELCIRRGSFPSEALS